MLSHKLKFTALAIALSAVLTGCSMVDVNPLSAPEAAETPRPEIKSPEPRSFVRISSPKHQILGMRTRVNRQNVSLMDAILAVNGLKNYQVVRKDSAVNMAYTIKDIRVSDMSVGDYLNYLSSVTNYHIELDFDGNTPVITVASMIMKKWNLQAMSNMPKAEISSGLSATISSGVSDDGEDDDSGSNGSGAKITINHTDDVWADTIENAKLIMGIEDDDDEQNTNTFGNGGVPMLSGSDSIPVPNMNGGYSDGTFSSTMGMNTNRKNNGTWLVSNKRMGTVTAFGKPNDIARLDAWLGDIEDNINRKIYLDVAILDVTTSKGNGYGIDWSAVYNNSGYTAGDSGLSSVGFSGNNTSPLTVVDGGAWSVSAAGKIGSFTLSALMSALSEEGSVKLQSQPKVTVTNGYTAYLGATEEISYVSNVEILPLSTADGGTSDSVMSTNLSRVSVGLKLAVTPRILPNNDILVEVVPILSSIKGYTPIQSNGEEISTPNIALQELSTQVITKSGEPIHLGGLIISRITENLKKAPLAAGKWSDLLGKALGSMKMEEEGRELLIVITPTEIN